MDYRTNRPIQADTELNECVSGRVKCSIKNIMEETNGALGELKAQLDELSLQIFGCGRTEEKQQTPVHDVNSMADQAELNRILAVACLKQFVGIKQALI